MKVQALANQNGTWRMKVRACSLKWRMENETIGPCG